jgi:hypothetical protein
MCCCVCCCAVCCSGRTGVETIPPEPKNEDT